VAGRGTRPSTRRPRRRGPRSGSAAAPSARLGRAGCCSRAGGRVARGVPASHPSVPGGRLSGPLAALLVLLPLALGRGDPSRGRCAAAPRPGRGRPQSRIEALLNRRHAGTSRHAVSRTDVTRSTWTWSACARAGGSTEPCPRLSSGARRGAGSASSPVGSGKSTLAALLLRFRAIPRRGRSSSAGSELERLALDDVRRTVGLVRRRPARLRDAASPRTSGWPVPAPTTPRWTRPLHAPASAVWLGRAHGRSRTRGSATAGRGVGRRAGPAGGRSVAAGRPAGAGPGRTDRPPRPRDARPSWPHRCSTRPPDAPSSGSRHEPLGLDRVDVIVQLDRPKGGRPSP
jgi:ATP-binding cassette subfamily C protein CydCD